MSTRLGVYALRRLLLAALTLTAASIATFALFFSLPSDPAALQCGRLCTPQQLDQVRHNLGLDRPAPEQYLEFMSGIFVGRHLGESDHAVHCPAPCFGYSFSTYEPVTDILTRSLPVTASIVLGGAALWLGGGVALGAIAGLRRGTWVDRAIVGVAAACTSAQPFFVGLMLQVVLVFGLGVLPRPGYTSPFEDPWGWVLGMVLPWATIALALSSAYARFTRSAVIDVLGEDYIVTARAKGLPRHGVARHALRGATTPIVTIAALDLGGLLGGVVIIETVFGMPGLGTISVRAVEELNLPVIMAVVLVSAAFVIVINALADVLYAVIDPRVRLA